METPDYQTLMDRVEKLECLLEDVRMFIITSGVVIDGEFSNRIDSILGYSEED